MKRLVEENQALEERLERKPDVGGLGYEVVRTTEVGAGSSPPQLLGILDHWITSVERRSWRSRTGRNR